MSDSVSVAESISTSISISIFISVSLFLKFPFHPNQSKQMTSLESWDLLEISSHCSRYCSRYCHSMLALERLVGFLFDCTKRDTVESQIFHYLVEVQVW